VVNVEQGGLCAFNQNGAPVARGLVEKVGRVGDEGREAFGVE
jgi:hypothetical protein